MTEEVIGAKSKRFKYDLWITLVKPVSIIFAIIIFIYIVQSFVNFSNSTKWIIIGILSVLWLIYYFKFEFSNPDVRPDEVQPDEV